jgi:phosphomannomutase
MKSLILFDVDGTLTIPRQKISQNMVDTLCKLNKIEDLDIGFVGGSDLCKQIEQLGEEI